LISLVYHIVEKSAVENGLGRILRMKVVEVKNVGSKPNLHGVDARSISDTKNDQVTPPAPIYM
jgi:hypothetical protein